MRLAMDWVRKLEVLSLERAFVCWACPLRAATGAIHDCRSSDGRRIDGIVQAIGFGRVRDLSFSIP